VLLLEKSEEDDCRLFSINKEKKRNGLDEAIYKFIGVPLIFYPRLGSYPEIRSVILNLFQNEDLMISESLTRKNKKANLCG